MVRVPIAGQNLFVSLELPLSEDELEERTDIPIRSPYKDVPVNGSIPLYEGLIRIQWKHGVTESEGSIALNLQGTPSIRFDATIHDPFVTIDVEAALQADANTFTSSIPYLARNGISQYSIDETKVRGIIHGMGVVIQERKADGKPEPVGRIQFHLVNFTEYQGTTLTEVDGQTWNIWNGRVVFGMGEWEITLDQFQDIGNRLAEAESVNGNVITHIGVLNLKNNNLFDPVKAKNVIDALYWFLSFIKGSRCAIVVPTGFRHLGRRLWQHWINYSVVPVKSHAYWLSTNSTYECFQAADMFYGCWHDEGKRKWLQLAIGLYLASNYNHSGIELDLTNSQILLEMLTWVALQEENTLMSDESFEKLPAADKVRALLFWLAVPTAIPTAFNELRSAFPNADAPGAAVSVRNLMMHLTKSNRAQRSQIPTEAVHQALKLNLWYTDLVLLKLIGYSGPYNNRTGNPHPGIEDFTPWASSK